MNDDFQLPKRADFESRGYAVLRDFLDPATIARLRERADELLRDHDPGTSASVFSSRDPARLDAHFLNSGDRIAYFFEEDAFDEAGQLRQPLQRSINKIGHALHELDEDFARLGADPRIAALAHSLGLQDPRQVQSMLIFKQPRIGGEVLLHQDAAYLHTEPVTVVGLWFALEDAHRGNGCLHVVPGRHALRRRFRRDGLQTHTEELDARPIAGEEIALEVPAGSLVLLHGLLPHRSGANHSDASRLAYALHLADGAAHWSTDNWLRREGPFPTLDAPSTGGA